MDISIDLGADMPLFAQLVEQVKHGVRTEALTPGVPLPSIRQLANDLGINQNTVAKAYRTLERDKVIVSRGYRGSFVHEEALANSQVDLAETAATAMAETVANLRDAGLTDSEIRIAFAAVMKNRSN